MKSESEAVQPCTTLCNPMDCSLPDSSIHEIFQARILEWIAISFSNAWKWNVKVKLLGHVRLLVTPWTAAYQTPLSMGFSRQEYWSGVPLVQLMNPNFMTMMVTFCSFLSGLSLWYCYLFLSHDDILKSKGKKINPEHKRWTYCTCWRQLGRWPWQWHCVWPGDTDSVAKSLSH